MPLHGGSNSKRLPSGIVTTLVAERRNAKRNHVSRPENHDDYRGIYRNMIRKMILMLMTLGVYLDPRAFPLWICPKASALPVIANVAKHVNELR